MHPLGALLLMEAVEDERRRAVRTWRNRRAAERPARHTSETDGAWAAILRFPRFGLDGSKA